MRRFEIRGSAGNGSLTSPAMPVIYSSLRVAIEFLDAEGDSVIPSAGLVDIEVSINGTIWEPIPGGMFDADDVGRGSRIWPECSGDVVYCRVTMTDIVGATSYIATIMRS